MNGKPSNFELLEPASPDALVPDPTVALWMILAVVLLGFLIAGYFLFRNGKKYAVVAPGRFRDPFHQEAATALEKINALQSRDAAVQASLILRKYLSLAAHDPALYETHEEFVSRHDALSVLTDEAREASEAGFARLASLKYASELPDVSPHDVVNESRSLLETLHHGFRA